MRYLFDASEFSALTLSPSRRTFLTMLTLATVCHLLGWSMRGPRCLLVTNEKSPGDEDKAERGITQSHADKRESPTSSESEGGNGRILNSSYWPEKVQWLIRWEGLWEQGERMGYKTVRNNDLDSLYRRKEGTQYFLFIANIVMLLVGLANFCVCIWIRSVWRG